MKTKHFLFTTLLILLGAVPNAIGQNTFFGTNTGLNNIGSRNSAFGELILNNVNSSGDHNSAVGYTALRDNTSGEYNCALGSQSLKTNTTGLGNVAVGYRSLESNSVGNYNVAVGYYSIPLSTGSNNIGLGNRSGNGLATGINNVFLGFKSGWELQTGDDNIIIGAFSGENLTTGSDNVLIGRVKLDPNPSTATTAGSNTSNSVIIASANPGIQRIFINGWNGYTGIGLGNNVIPQNRLEIGTGLNGTSGLRFRGINQNSTEAFSTNGKVLTVDINGDVVLAIDQGSAASVEIVNGQNTMVSGNGTSGNPYQIDATQLQIQEGTNITFTGDGTPGNPLIINSSGGGGNNDNIYTTDGTLAGNRIVTMNNNRLMFDTDTNGAIYVGDRNDITNNANFPTTTGDYRMYVEGGILTEKVKVALRSTANWADFVFEDDYNPSKLNEIEKYIKENKHLPGIASADELVENGLDLADMQAKQMQKIEELTLYAIEQDKQLKKQSEEIELLKAQVKALLKRQ